MANKNKNSTTAATNFLGNLFAFNNSLKLIHWSITGIGSYEAHISLDQAIESVKEVLDRLVETSFSLLGPLDIVIPETSKPKDHIAHIKNMYKKIEEDRKIFTESFSQSIIDDYQEAIQQLLFRLKRLE